MLKYLEHEVTFREVPDEITLCINISGCPNHCKGCHSSHLWEDIGTELTLKNLYDLIEPCRKGITCVAFMGGDQDPATISLLALVLKETFPDIKVAWYSGKQELAKEIDVARFDYIKLGPYIEELGPLDNPNTNQRLYRVFKGSLKDITSRFWTSEVIENEKDS